jgi:hypothetical protein
LWALSGLLGYNLIYDNKEYSIFTVKLKIELT